MLLYSGTTDILYPKIDADQTSRLATDDSEGVHHLARQRLRRRGVVLGSTVFVCTNINGNTTLRNSIKQ